MKAVTFQGKEKVEITDVPDPVIQDPTDIVLKVSLSSICGSDLHAYEGRIPFPVTGWTLGHEYVGVVEEVGSKVNNFQPGDRVAGAFVASCGECFYCKDQWPSLCLKQRTFGYGQLGGAQAEFIRVPFGDSTLEKLPDSVTNNQAVFIGDCLSAGYFCAESAAIDDKSSVVVVGCGSVGIFCVMSALEQGAKKVIAVDVHPERLALAAKVGAIPAKLDENPGAIIRDYTEGRGADCVLEAAGSEVSLKSCFNYVRPGGVISVAGAYAEPEFPFPMFQAFLRDLTFKIGVCPSKNYMSKLISLTEKGIFDPSIVITHSLSLLDASTGYDIFSNRKDGCIKVTLEP